MIYHLIFFISYLFYLYVFYNNINELINILFLYPLVIYGFLFIITFYLNKINKNGFWNNLKKTEKFLSVFLFLFISPFFLKMNIPDPHNFLLRKLELIAGTSYVLFVILVIVYCFFIINKLNIVSLYDEKKLFFNIIALFFLFYFFISLWFNYANQPTGDEPIYLLVAHSIIYERNIDLKNNYQNKDYKNFYRGELQSQELEIDGKEYSYHPVFYSFIITPFYFLGKRFGVTLFSNFLSAFYLGILFLLIFNIFKDKNMALFSVLLNGLSMPFIIYINQICTEVLSGVLIITVFYLILFNKNIGIITAITLLIPWAHSRNLIIWVLLIFIFVYEFRKEIDKIIKFLFFQILSIAALFLFNFTHYKAIIPRQTSEAMPFFEAFNFRLTGILGIFLDQEFGLLFYAPFLIFIFSGFYFLYKEDKKIFYYTFLILIPYYFFISSWKIWNGGGGSSNRFFVAVIFIFIILFLAVYKNIKDKFSKKIIDLSIGLGFIISFIIFLIPWFRWNKGFGENWILKILSQITHFKISLLFPSLWYHPEKNIIQVAVFIIIIIAINFYILIKNKRV